MMESFGGGKVRIVRLGSSGSVLSTSGPGLEEVTQRLHQAGQCLPRLSDQAERLLKALNSGSVYSVPASRPVLTDSDPSPRQSLSNSRISPTGQGPTGSIQSSSKRQGQEEYIPECIPVFPNYNKLPSGIEIQTDSYPQYRKNRKESNSIFQQDQVESILSIEGLTEFDSVTKQCLKESANPFSEYIQNSETTSVKGIKDSIPVYGQDPGQWETGHEARLLNYVHKEDSKEPGQYDGEDTFTSREESNVPAPYFPISSSPCKWSGLTSDSSNDQISPIAVNSTPVPVQCSNVEDLSLKPATYSMKVWPIDTRNNSGLVDLIQSDNCDKFMKNSKNKRTHSFNDTSEINSKKKKPPQFEEKPSHRYPEDVEITSNDCSESRPLNRTFSAWTIGRYPTAEGNTFDAVNNDFSPIPMSQFESQEKSLSDNSNVLSRSISPVMDKSKNINNLGDNTNISCSDDSLDSFIERRLDSILNSNESIANKKIQTKEKNNRIKPVSVRHKPVFTVPIKQKKMTEYFSENKPETSNKNKLNEKENYPIDMINENINQSQVEQSEIELCGDNFGRISAILETARELGFVIMFREGFSQFRDCSALGSGFGNPKTVLIRLVNEQDEVFFLRVELWNKKTNNDIRQYFWNNILLHKTAMKLAYDGKAFLNSIVPLYPDQDSLLSSCLLLLDPLIGCWLIQPDRPLSSFQGCVTCLGVTSSCQVLGSDIAESSHGELTLLSDLFHKMLMKLESVGLWSVFYNLEMRILPVLVTMERRGVSVDSEHLRQLGNILISHMKCIEMKAHQMAGRSFNISSPQQVRAVLYDEMKLDQISGLQISKTTGGVKSTCETVLKGLTSHPLPGIILQYRHLAKCKTTYVDGLLQHCEGGKVFTCWDQVAAATGRLTSVSPNLQAIPKGDIDLGNRSINLRSAIVSSDNLIFLAADFEQIEFRVFGQLSQDPQLLTAFKQGGDIFIQLASSWLGKQFDDISSDDREKTKKVVYGLMYGAGRNKLAEILSISLNQATTIIQSFSTKFSTFRSFSQKVISRAEKEGFVSSILGRRRYFPNLKSSNPMIKSQAQRQAFNFLVQGSAADIAKHGLLVAQDNLEKAGITAHLVLMIHDELVWEVLPADLERAAKVVLESLGNTKGLGQKFKVPFNVKISSGKSLGNLKSIFK